MNQCIENAMTSFVQHKVTKRGECDDACKEYTGTDNAGACQGHCNDCKQDEDKCKGSDNPECIWMLVPL